MTKTVKILIPIIIIVTILASVLLGVSLFLTPAEAATSSAEFDNLASAVEPDTKNTNVIIQNLNSSSYFYVKELKLFDLSVYSNVSGLYCMTCYITPGADISCVPSGTTFSVPSLSFKFMVFCYFDYSTPKVSGTSNYYAQSAYLSFSGDVNRYSSNWADDIDNSSKFFRSVTYNSYTYITNPGYYSFYFNIPSTFSNYTPLMYGITGTYRVLDGTTAYSYQVDNVSLARVSKVYETGYTAGHDVGYTEGYSAGNTAGHDAGYTEGYSVGNTAGHEAGYTEGYEAGNTAGHDAGYTEGYDLGYPEGYAAGEVNSENYTNGYNSGNEVGYATGYDVGYTEGLSTATSLDGTGLGALGGTISATTNMILKAFDTVGQLNVFGITIWSLIGVAVAIAIIFFVVKIIKR